MTTDRPHRADAPASAHRRRDPTGVASIRRVAELPRRPGVTAGRRADPPRLRRPAGLARARHPAVAADRRVAGAPPRRRTQWRCGARPPRRSAGARRATRPVRSIKTRARLARRQLGARAVPAGHCLHRWPTAAAAADRARRDARRPPGRAGQGGPAADRPGRRPAGVGIRPVDAGPHAAGPARRHLRSQRRRARPVGPGAHRGRQPAPGRGSRWDGRDLRQHARPRPGSPVGAAGGDGGQGPRLRLRRPPDRHRQGGPARSPGAGRRDHLPGGPADPARRRYGAEHHRAHRHRRQRDGRTRAEVRGPAARTPRRVDDGSGAGRALDPWQSGGDLPNRCPARTSSRPSMDRCSTPWSRR